MFLLSGSWIVILIRVFSHQERKDDFRKMIKKKILGTHTNQYELKGIFICRTLVANQYLDSLIIKSLFSPNT